MLAHNCAIVGIGVNFERLYSGVDPDYELVLSVLSDLVHATKDRSP